MSTVTGEWLTSYCTIALQCDSPIIEAIAAYWRYVLVTVRAYEQRVNRQLVWSVMDDMAIVHLLIVGDGRILAHVPQPDHTPAMCVAAVHNYPEAIQWVQHPTLDMCRSVVQANPHNLRHINATLQEAYPELCWSAINNDGAALQHVSYFIRQANAALCVAAVQNSAAAIQYTPLKVRLTRPDIDHIAVTHNPLALKWIPHPWYELCMLAVQKNGLMLQFVPAHLQDDHLCITAVKNDSRAVQYVHDRTRWLLILGSMALVRVVA